MLMRHGVPGRLRLSLVSGEPQEAQALAAALGGDGIALAGACC
jgi:hypothetical protein